MADDPLDGFRSRTVSEAEAGPLKLRGEVKGLIDTAIRGADLEDWIKNSKGAALYEECQSALVESIDQLLEQEDIASEQARAAHYNARVALGVLTKVNHVLLEARRAQEELANVEVNDGEGDRDNA